MTALVSGVLGLLRAAPTFEDLCSVSLAGARRLADADGATFVLRDGERCFYVDEDSIGQLWKGQRFPLDQCISGWAMTTAQPALIPDIRSDFRIPQDAYQPTFVRSLAMVPMGTVDPIGAIGVYWAEIGQAVKQDVLDQLLELAAEAGNGVRRLGIAAAPWAPNFALRDVTPPVQPARSA